MIRIFTFIPKDNSLNGEIEISTNSIEQKHSSVWIKKYLADKKTGRIILFKNKEDAQKNFVIEIQEKENINNYLKNESICLEYYLFYEETRWFDFVFNIFKERLYRW
jgi:hypothetical protein